MNIPSIINKIDEYLNKNGKSSTNPVEANAMLEKAGLLRDSDLRPGLPLRNLLRRGLIPHAYQSGGKGSSWVIPHSGKYTIKPAPILSKVNEVIPIKSDSLNDGILTTNPFNNTLNLQKAGFEGFLPISLLLNNISKIPAQKGVYMVIYNSVKEPVFQLIGTGGYFKGKDPNVSLSELKNNWVDGSNVIYIGKAGGTASTATLRSRLSQYLRFGNGENLGHYGGRYIWQLTFPDKLICWKQMMTREPKEEESRLINLFVEIYGKRPFANLQD